MFISSAFEGGLQRIYGTYIPFLLSNIIEVKYLSSRDYLNTHDESEQAIKPLLFKSLQ